MKKVKILGKGIPMFAIVILGLALVSAVLLPYFGQITGNAVVYQGLRVDGHDWNVPVVDSLGPIYSNVGGTSMKAHVLTNNAGEASEVTLTKTSCTRDGGWPHSCAD